MCLHPLLRVPLTTMVARQALALDPAKAAANAIDALGNLSKTRAAWNGSMGVAWACPGVRTRLKLRSLCGSSLLCVCVARIEPHRGSC